MPIWKKKDQQGNVHFQFLCSSCNQNKKVILEQENWTLVRDDEPAACNDCALQCALTAQALWGAEDQVRYRICGECPTYDQCPLKGRYYC